MRLCGRCKAAENPLSNLRFADSIEGALCEKCYSRFYGGPEIRLPGDISGLNQYAVIKCPNCRGNSRECKSCVGYGVVRIAHNAIPVFNPEDMIQRRNTATPH